METQGNNYKNGKIYKIVNLGYNECYFGSTTQSLSRRLSEHKRDFKRFARGENVRNVSSFRLFEKYGAEGITSRTVSNSVKNGTSESRRLSHQGQPVCE